jgi:hypothetical protein
VCTPGAGHARAEGSNPGLRKSACLELLTLKLGLQELANRVSSDREALHSPKLLYSLKIDVKGQSVGL